MNEVIERLLGRFVVQGHEVKQLEDDMYRVSISDGKAIHTRAFDTIFGCGYCIDEVANSDGKTEVTIKSLRKRAK